MPRGTSDSGSSNGSDGGGAILYSPGDARFRPPGQGGAPLFSPPPARRNPPSAQYAPGFQYSQGQHGSGSSHQPRQASMNSTQPTSVERAPPQPRFNQTAQPGMASFGDLPSQQRTNQELLAFNNRMQSLNVGPSEYVHPAHRVSTPSILTRVPAVV